MDANNDDGGYFDDDVHLDYIYLDDINLTGVDAGADAALYVNDDGVGTAVVGVGAAAMNANNNGVGATGVAANNDLGLGAAAMDANDNLVYAAAMDANDNLNGALMAENDLGDGHLNGGQMAEGALRGVSLHFRWIYNNTSATTKVVCSCSEQFTLTGSFGKHLLFQCECGIWYVYRIKPDGQIEVNSGSSLYLQ